MKFVSIILITLFLSLFSPLKEILIPKTAFAENTITFPIQITNRHVIGKKKIRVFQGDQIILLWRTDEDVELHLHGYDIKIKIVTGKAIPMLINARATGRFPVTSHGFSGEKVHTHAKGALFYIEVHPR